MRRLLILGVLTLSSALLPACAVGMEDPESEELGSENSELVQGVPEGTDPGVATPGEEDPEITSPLTHDPSGPTPDPMTSDPTGPTPDPMFNPVDSETQKKSAH